MKFSDEHESMRSAIAQFIDKEINPHCLDWEENGPLPAHELFLKLGQQGYLGICKPVEFGGMGLDYSFQLVFAEELGRILSGGVAMAIGVQTDMATPALARFGSDELRSEVLTDAINGKAVMSIAVSEASGGSDVASIKTSARSDGDDYLINGSKMWITNATQADYLCLLANTSEGPMHANKSLIVVPANTPGISFSEPLNKLGMRSSDTAQIFFDSVRVPKRYRIGDEGQGFRYQMEQFQEERLFAAAGNLKRMEHCINETILYTRERRAFNQSVLDNQVVHFRLAELQTEVEACRALVYDAVENYLSGTDVTMKASMVKLKVGRLVREVADSCLQYWGGMGYMWDNPVSRVYRDERLVSIGAGADEVMLSIICKHMGILPSRS
ncbi:MAG: acyl-CoA dehydrogenase family protein [Pseudomonadota bacterium]